MTASAETETDSVEIAFPVGHWQGKVLCIRKWSALSGRRTPITGAKGAITKTVNNLANASFDGDKIREGLFSVVNCKVAILLSQIRLRELITFSANSYFNAFTTALKGNGGPTFNEFNCCCCFVIEERPDEAAERARNAILNQEKKEAASKKRKVQMPDKFKDCEKHGEDSLLIVCEGNSALAGLMPARDVNTEACMRFAVR